MADTQCELDRAGAHLDDLTQAKGHLIRVYDRSVKIGLKSFGRHASS